MQHRIVICRRRRRTRTRNQQRQVQSLRLIILRLSQLLRSRRRSAMLNQWLIILRRRRRQQQQRWKQTVPHRTLTQQKITKSKMCLKQLMMVRSGSMLNPNGIDSTWSRNHPRPPRRRTDAKQNAVHRDAITVMITTQDVMIGCATTATIAQADVVIPVVEVCHPAQAAIHAVALRHHQQRRQQ